MPKKRRKKAHHAKAHHVNSHRTSQHKKSGAGHHSEFVAAAQAHHRKRRHSRAGALPPELRRAADRPVTVKTLKDIVALRRVQRGLV